jgi:hypothetical protein
LLLESQATAPRSLTNRSQITNDPFRLPGLDKRSPAGRRFRDLVAELSAELGGVDTLGRSALELVRQAAMDVMRTENLQAALMRGESVNDEELTRAGNSATRSLKCLGIRRERHDRTPSLADILAEHAAQPDDAA